jgi:hypothetical protein
VTGKTVEDDLDDLEKDGFFERTSLYLENYKIKPEEVERKLKQRAARWEAVEMKREGVVLGLFTRTAGATDKGASMLRDCI